MAKPKETLESLQAKLEAMQKELNTLKFRYNKLQTIVIKRDQMIVQMLRDEIGK